MNPTLFAFLDRAVEAGGMNVSGAVISGTKTANVKVLELLCNAGYLIATGKGKSPKYSVTSPGRDAWAHAAPQERVQEINRRDADKHQQMMVDFLKFVKLHPGKVLSATEQNRYPELLRQQACKERLIEARTARSYELLPAGEEFLLAELPIEEQLDGLRNLSRQAVQHWQAAQKRITREIDTLGLQLDEAMTEIENQRRAIADVFESAVSGLGAFAGLVTAARKIQDELESRLRAERVTLDTEKAKIASMKETLRAEVQQSTEQILSLDKQVEMNVDRAKPQVQTNGNGHANPPKKELPPESVIWEATKTAYQKLRQKTITIGGIVKIPELSDEVIAMVPGMTKELVLKHLLAWHDRDKLTLQLCNDPYLEPRAEEGIRTALGLLYYIRF